MAVEIKLSKFDNTPWGFRLVGGADFDTPLTVIKVSEGSLAEDAGMRLGDTVVRVNDTALAELSHAQAHDLIREAGNNFTLAVFRGKVGDPVPTPKPLQVAQIFPKSEAVQALEKLQETQGEIKMPEPGEEPVLEYALPPGELEKLDIKVARSETSSVTSMMTQLEGVTEVMYAEKSSKSEFKSITAAPRGVKLHYTVDMNTDPNFEIKPKAAPGEGLGSDQWSSFLQKPNNAIPKTKKQDEAERAKEPPYRVVITKIKRKLSRDLNEYKEKGLLEKNTEISSTEDTQNIKASDPIQLENEPAVQPEVQPAAQPEVQPVEPPVAQPTPPPVAKVEEIPDLPYDTEPVKEPEPTKEEEIIKRQELLTDISSTAANMLSQFLNSSKMISESELSMEDQLALVQKQLLALSQLPVAIQATLTAVTSQLAKIVKPGQAIDQDESKADELDSKAITEETVPTSTAEPKDGDNKIPMIIEENTTDISQGESIGPTPAPTPTPEPEITPEEQEKIDKRLKEDRKAIEERQIFEDQLNKNRNVKSHFPSAPLNRPIVLPGGKKWREPDDVIPRKINARKYTDELIAETISSQSEIITGTTLGINFLKYKPKPPKNLDHLQESEVYKMVHSLDLPTRGIAGRPSLVVAEEDVRSLQKQIEEDMNVVQIQLPTQKQQQPQLEP